MTRLPAAPKDIGAARLDLLPYMLLYHCSNPFCDRQATEEHHITRRSHVGRGQDAWWVEIKGVPRPNVVGLCSDCHRAVTLGETWIKLVGDEYVWREHGVSEFLDPHPSRKPKVAPDENELASAARWLGMDDLADTFASTPGEPEGEYTGDLPMPEAALATETASSPSAFSGETEGGEEGLRAHAGTTEISTGSPPSVSPGETCPLCDRRVPHKRKPSSPKSKPFAFRIPFDEVEQFVEILDSAAAHWGIEEVPYHRYRLLLDALVLVLQTESREAVS